MTKTVKLVPVIVVLFTVSLMTIQNIDYAEAALGNCAGDCVPPTMGYNIDNELVVEGGLTINGQSFDVEPISQFIPTQTLKTASNNAISVIVYEDGGVSLLEHVSLSIKSTEIVGDQSQFVSMAWDNVLGKETVSVLDPHGFVKNVNVNASPIDNFRTKVSFSFILNEAIDSSTLKVTAWDQNRNSNNNHFLGAVGGQGKSMASEPMEMMSSGDCGTGLTSVVQTVTGMAACILPHHVSIWNTYGWEAA